MAIGAAFAVIAAGAILKWAVTAHVSWLNVQTTGTVLFVVGLVALPLSIVYTFYWTGRREEPGDRAYRPPSA
jgi:heme/copper-type cytochrome/quinol oxidase subunit 2